MTPRNVAFSVVLFAIGFQHQSHLGCASWLHIEPISIQLSGPIDMTTFKNLSLFSWKHFCLFYVAITKHYQEHVTLHQFKHLILYLTVFCNKCLWISPIDIDYLTTFKPVLSSHTREAQNVAALGRWLLNRGEYQYQFYSWEHFVWLLKTGCCLIGVTAYTGLTVVSTELLFWVNCYWVLCCFFSLTCFEVCNTVVS